MKDTSRNDQKENKEKFDKGPQKDKHVNQYGTKDKKVGLGKNT